MASGQRLLTRLVTSDPAAQLSVACMVAATFLVIVIDSYYNI